MKEDYSAIINDIHTASENKKLTFFVGAGVSRCSGTKGWGELIEEIAFNLNEKPQIKFNPASFITTYFDDLLERAAVKNCKTFISVSKEDEIANKS